MTEPQRREFSAVYQQRIMIFEKKYEKAFNSVLKKQYDKVAQVLQTQGMNAAKHTASHLLFDPALAQLLNTCHKEVGLYIAQRTDQQIHTELRRPIQKTGRIGFNPRWLQNIVQFFHDRLMETVTDINTTTRNRIEEVLAEAQEEGWGIDETVRNLQSEDLTRNRAALIARTETAKAANAGREAAVATVGFRMNKEWISAHDNRVRAWHLEADGTVIDEEENFVVDGEEMTGPGDPDAEASNVCNCRCTMAFLPQRDARGKLIPKQIQ